MEDEWKRKGKNAEEREEKVRREGLPMEVGERHNSCGERDS